MVNVLCSGRWIKCYACDGRGIIRPSYPSECDLCNGGGLLWLYRKGALAKYPSGPFIGKLTLREHQSLMNIGSIFGESNVAR